MKKSKSISLVLICAALASCAKKPEPQMKPISNRSTKQDTTKTSNEYGHYNRNDGFFIWNQGFGPYNSGSNGYQSGTNGYYNGSQQSNDGSTYRPATQGIASSKTTPSSGISSTSTPSSAPKSSTSRGGFGGFFSSGS